MPERRNQPYSPDAYRPKDTLRPAGEIAAVWEKTKQDAEYWDIERAQIGATDAWLANLNQELVDSLGAEPGYARDLVKAIELDQETTRALGWRGALQFARKGVSSAYFDALLDEEINLGKIDAPKHARSLIVITDAEIAVNGFIEDSLIQKQLSSADDPIRTIGHGYLPGQLREELDIRQGLSLDRPHGTQKKSARRKSPYRQRVEAFTELHTKLEVFRSYKGATGHDEAIAFVLNEEDENNGLAKLVTKHRQTPPRE